MTEHCSYHVLMPMCAACGEDKESSEFGPDKRKRNGLKSRCYTCLRVTDRSRYHAEAIPRRAYALDKYYAAQREIFELFGGRCAVCSEADWTVLSVDHIHGDGYLEGPARGGVRNYNRVRMNPERYQLLCANCHRRKTIADRQRKNGAP